MGDAYRFCHLTEREEAIGSPCTNHHYCSGLDHAERVRRIAEDIGRRESADLGVLGVAALLNDIGVHIKQTSLDANPDFIRGNAFYNDINPIYCYICLLDRIE